MNTFIRHKAVQAVKERQTDRYLHKNGIKIRNMSKHPGTLC